MSQSDIPPSLPLDGEGAECNEADEVRQINEKYITFINPLIRLCLTANPPSPQRGKAFGDSTYAIPCGISINNPKIILYRRTQYLHFALFHPYNALPFHKGYCVFYIPVNLYRL